MCPKYVESKYISRKYIDYENYNGRGNFSQYKKGGGGKRANASRFFLYFLIKYPYARCLSFASLIISLIYFQSTHTQDSIFLQYIFFQSTPHAQGVSFILHNPFVSI